MRPRLQRSFSGRGTPRASSVCAGLYIFLLSLRDGEGQGLQDPMFLESSEKTLMLGGIGGQEEEQTTEDEMAGWHPRLDGHEFE